MDVSVRKWVFSVAIWLFIASCAGSNDAALVFMLYSVGFSLYLNGPPPYRTPSGSQSDYIALFLLKSALLWLCNVGTHFLLVHGAATSSYLVAPFVGAWAVAAAVASFVMQ